MASFLAVSAKKHKLVKRKLRAVGSSIVTTRSQETESRPTTQSSGSHFDPLDPRLESQGSLPCDFTQSEIEYLQKLESEVDAKMELVRETVFNEEEKRLEEECFRYSSNPWQASGDLPGKPHESELLEELTFFMGCVRHVPGLAASVIREELLLGNEIDSTPLSVDRGSRSVQVSSTIASTDTREEKRRLALGIGGPFRSRRHSL